MGLASESGWILQERMEMLSSQSVRRRGASCATERGEGLCNPCVGRRFRRLLPCVVEIDGYRGLWTVDGASASSISSRHVSRGAPERSGKAPQPVNCRTCVSGGEGLCVRVRLRIVTGLRLGCGRSACIVALNVLYRSCAKDFVHRIRTLESCVVRLP